MKIIGINVFDMDKSIIKTLRPDWYPFGNYPKPDNNGLIDLKRYYSTIEKEDIYTIGNIPHISISAIVGMNGSGKSTLLDIIYRILNNLAFKLLSKKETPIEHNLCYAYGVHAELYCAIDNKFIRVACHDDKISYDYGNEKYLKSFKFSDKQFDNVLKTFFYTIGINYSIYAFNKWDYKPQYDNGKFIDGNWLDGVFHKNDGYLTPITLAPFREDGHIDIQKENELAIQRIVALSILARANNCQFPAGYFPDSIEFNLKKFYKEEKINSLNKKYPDIGPDSLSRLIKLFEFSWEIYLNTLNFRYLERNTEEYETALFYLAYKTIKICFTYNDYCELLNPQQIYQIYHRNNNSDVTAYENAILKPLISKVIHKIIENLGDHITLKIGQCLEFMKNEQMDMQIHEEVNNFIYFHKPKTYDDVVKHLCPPFYEMNLQFKKASKYKKYKSWNFNGDSMSLSSMSSGEKQMLYAMSYILYHIKNIQSVNEDKYRVPYHHINIIMDEVELYFHPDYQRRFISMLINCLSWSKIDKRIIRSINFIIATHSPFVLSDILTENSLYLKDGRRIKVEKQTFGGNYYDMLKGSFFFEKSSIGDISSSYIRKWVKKKKQTGQTPPEDVLSMIGDPFIKRFLEL